VPSLTGKRVLVLGAETPDGRSLAPVLAVAGAQLALVAANPDAESAFAVQRLARRLNAVSQAIDAANETAVRVMLRQVSKQLGGLDAIVFCAEPLHLPHALALGSKELARSGSRTFVAVVPPGAAGVAAPSGIDLHTVTGSGDPQQTAAAVLACIAGPADNR